jgi:hypothetical protein
MVPAGLADRPLSRPANARLTGRPFVPVVTVISPGDGEVVGDLHAHQHHSDLFYLSVMTPSSTA